MTFFRPSFSHQKRPLRVSPPLTVCFILVIGLVAATWMKPVPPIPAAQSPRVTIEIPATVYAALALRLKDQKDAHGQPLTVTRWLADLAGRTDADPGTPRQGQ